MTCESIARSMTRDQSFEENMMEKYVECVDAAIGQQTGAARDTMLDETVIRDAKGGIARLRCMIITVKKGRRALYPRTSQEITGCPEARGFSPHDPKTLSTLTSNKN